MKEFFDIRFNPLQLHTPCFLHDKKKKSDKFSGWMIEDDKKYNNVDLTLSHHNFSFYFILPACLKNWLLFMIMANNMNFIYTRSRWNNQQYDKIRGAKFIHKQEKENLLCENNKEDLMSMNFGHSLWLWFTYHNFNFTLFFLLFILSSFKLIISPGSWTLVCWNVRKNHLLRKKNLFSHENIHILRLITQQPSCLSEIGNDLMNKGNFPR